jgi:hypothetical protein
MTQYAITEPFLTKLIGLASYQLGRVARLMNPYNPDLKRLHYSAPDTAVLYDLLHRWIYVYGRAEAARSISGQH